MNKSAIYFIYAAMFFLSGGIFHFNSSNLFAEEAARQVYFCPMHPHVHSFEQGVCPICGMRLEKMPPGTPKPIKDASGSPKEQIPGRKSVYLDEMQFQLSGSSLTKVKRQEINVKISASGKVISQKALNLYVPERDLPFVVLGSNVKATAPMFGAKILIGKISNLDAILDPMTKTLRVEVELRTAQAGLKPEGSIFAEIEYARQKALAVPREAILSFGEYTYVFLLDDTKTKLTPQKITTGIEDEKYVEILSGLSEGQTISSGPNFLIDSESRIQVGRGQ